MLLKKKPVIKNCRLAPTGIVAAVLSSGALAMGLAALPVQAQNPALRSPVPTARPAPSQSNALQDQPPAGPELAPSAAPASAPTGPALAAPAEDVPKLPLNQALVRRGDVTFRNMTMDAALFTIGETWRVNIVTGKQMEGTVNGVFKQTTLREVLDAILLANGYSYRVIGESLVIQPSADVGSGHPLFRSLTIPVQHGSVEEIVEGATLLKSASGQVKSFPRSRTIMVVDYADRVEAIAAFVNKMDAAAAAAAGGAPVQLQSRLDVAYFHTHFIPAANAQQAILSVLSPMGRVAIMQHENRLVAVDFAQNLDMVRKVLDRVDRPRPQVRITALIYDISLQDAEQLGLNWGHEGKSNAVNADATGAVVGYGYETTGLPILAGQVPEPGSMLMAAFGSLALIGAGLRRRLRMGIK
jgi:general secretion pathway protein D